MALRSALFVYSIEFHGQEKGEKAESFVLCVRVLWPVESVSAQRGGGKDICIFPPVKSPEREKERTREREIQSDEVGDRETSTS